MLDMFSPTICKLCSLLCVRVFLKFLLKQGSFYARLLSEPKRYIILSFFAVTV